MSSAWQEFERASRDSSRRLLVLGALLAVVVLAALRYFGAESDQPAAAADVSEPVLLTPTPEVAFDIDQLTGPEAAPPPQAVEQRPRAGNQSTVGVFECVVNGQRVLSDRPCGPEAQVRTLEVDRPDPRDVALQQQRLWAAEQPSRARSTTAPGSSLESATRGSPATASNADACAQVDKEIAALNARMRQGYDSQLGEWFRAEWHRLQDRRAALNCGR